VFHKTKTSAECAQTAKVLSVALVTALVLLVLSDQRAPGPAAVLLTACAICILLAVRNGTPSKLVTASSRQQPWTS
jgi:hypothetical protein